jgi:hypothetical protein
MSFDLAVWYPEKRIANDEAGKLYAELTARHPEIDGIPEEKIDDHDYCPWSCAMDHSPGHVIMSCVWPKATYVHQIVEDLARRHGLALYDPQSDVVTYADGSTGVRQANRGALLWILGSFALLFSATFVYSEQMAPSRAPLLVYVFAVLCGLLAVACFRQAWRRRHLPHVLERKSR